MSSARAMVRLGLGALLATAGGLAIARVWFSVPRPEAVLSARTARVAMSTGFSERANRDVQIRVWNQALDADPTSALVRGQLAGLHLQRAREGGGWDDYVTAEAFARQSLGKRTRRNASTASTLVSILLAQHRFIEAREIATDLVAREPDVPQYRATLGEVAMELGDYDEAERQFRSVWAQRSMLSIAPRVARWLEVTNHSREARQLLVSARDDALSRRDIAKETQAWFHLRLGDLDLRNGHWRAAVESFRAGLAIEPDDPRLLAAMARVAESRDDAATVIAWGERAIGLQLDPATLGYVASAYEAQGDTARAREYAQALEVSVSQQPGAYHRAWSLFLLDHGVRVAEVLARAEADVASRPDIYGQDVLAWALAKSGRHAEARVAMRAALRFGTRDPLLQRHAKALGLHV